MIPSRLVFCDALPILPSGKVDRKAIRTRVAGQSNQPAAASGLDALTETERTLIGIWERTLNIKPVRRRDHFFSIGGDSLSAVTMMLEVEATFDITLPFRLVFEVSTLDRLAERIDSTRAPQPETTSDPKKVGGPGNDAFVHALWRQAGGIPLFFYGVEIGLAQKAMWNLDCPLYSGGPWALGHGFATARSIEDLARVQIDGLRSFHPHGPYRLAGYSFGGVVVLEMAHQLRRAGETVELLFLLDPSEPMTAGDTRHVEPPLPLAKESPETPGARTIRRPVWGWLSYYLLHFYGRHPNPVFARLRPKNRGPALWHGAKRLGRSYQPQPYGGEVLAIFNADPHRRKMWLPLLGPTADIRTIDSHHDEMFTEPGLLQWLVPLRTRLEGKS